PRGGLPRPEARSGPVARRRASPGSPPSVRPPGSRTARRSPRAPRRPDRLAAGASGDRAPRRDSGGRAALRRRSPSPSPSHPRSRPRLAVGQGRSYGDVCLNDGGTVLTTGRLDRFISFDEKSGVVRCEAGMTVADLISFALPRGFFVPVVPGTQMVSVGGAIAN